jgi:GNAT superfamily N-acetyltransferase
VLLRPERPEDERFIFRLYASTRTEELAQVPWSDEQKAAFLDMQLRAQLTDYRRNYPDAEWLVMEFAGEPVGRLYLHRRDASHHVLDIALLPQQRGRGIGGAVIRALLDEAAGVGKPVTVHVEKYNPAMRLYRRLGFVTDQDQGVYDLMRRTASS